MIHVCAITEEHQHHLLVSKLGSNPQRGCTILTPVFDVSTLLQQCLYSCRFVTKCSDHQRCCAIIGFVLDVSPRVDEKSCNVGASLFANPEKSVTGCLGSCFEQYLNGFCVIENDSYIKSLRFFGILGLDVGSSVQQSP